MCGWNRHHHSLGRGDQSRGHGCRRSAAGTPGCPIQIPGIAARPQQAGFGGGHKTQFRGVRFTHRDESRLFVAAHEFAVVIGNVMRHFCPEGHAHALVGGDEVFD